MLIVALAKKAAGTIRTDLMQTIQDIAWIVTLRQTPPTMPAAYHGPHLLPGENQPVKAR